MYFGFAVPPAKSYPPPPYLNRERLFSLLEKPTEAEEEQAVAPISGGKYEEIISDCNRSALNTQTKDNDDKD